MFPDGAFSGSPTLTVSVRVPLSRLSITRFPKASYLLCVSLDGLSPVESQHHEGEGLAGFLLSPCSLESTGDRVNPLGQH